MEADAALILARWTYYCAVTVLFGSSLFEVYGVEECGERARLVARPVAAALAVAALVGAGLWLLCFASAVGDTQDAATTLRGILFESSFGPIWLVRLSALAIAVPAAWASRPGAVAVATAVALACEGWSGHAAAFRTVGSLAQVAHVVCAGAWIGGLVPLGVLVIRARRDAAIVPVAEAALRRFSRLGVLFVVTVTLTGVANRWQIDRSPDLGAVYDQVLAAKVALFGIMVATAALNRWSLLPRLHDAGVGAVARPFSRNIAVEQLLGVAILLVVSVLGLTNPYR